MIRLDIPKENYWIDLSHGVSVKVRPLSTAIYEAAKAKGIREARKIFEEHAEIRAVGGVIENLPDVSDVDALEGLSQLIFSQSLACFAIVEWKGVEAKEGGPAEVTQEAIEDLMLIHRMAEDFTVKYTRTHEQLISEGNASRPSPSGTSAEGQDTAEGAKTQAAPAQTGA